LAIQPDRRAAPLIATAFVLLGGAAACLGIIFAFGEAKPVPIAIACGSIVGLAVVLWLLRDKPEAKQRHWFSWVLARNARPARSSYRPKAAPQAQQFGTNRPPTVEEVRELKSDLRTWVPSQTRAARFQPGARSDRGDRSAENDR
jgi:hypothetical protein